MSAANPPERCVVDGGDVSVVVNVVLSVAVGVDRVSRAVAWSPSAAVRLLLARLGLAAALSPVLTTLSPLLLMLSIPLLPFSFAAVCAWHGGSVVSECDRYVRRSGK